jgi:hypothetical protein
MLSVDHQGCDPQSRTCAEEVAAKLAAKGSSNRVAHTVVDEYVIPSRVASTHTTQVHASADELVASKTMLVAKQQGISELLHRVEEDAEIELALVGTNLSS